MLHIPLLRHGRPYRSLDVVRTPHYRTREPFVEISQANAGRLNIGPIATNHIQWDQPHEGNQFDHLYARRAFQRAREAMAS
jgi:hypothetical protein